MFSDTDKIVEFKYRFHELTLQSKIAYNAIISGCRNVWLPEASNLEGGTNISISLALAKTLTRLYLLPKINTPIEPLIGVASVTDECLATIADFNTAKTAFKTAFLALKKSTGTSKSMSRQVKSWLQSHPDKALRDFLRSENLAQIDTTACYRLIRTLNEPDILAMHFSFERTNRGICKQVKGRSVYDVALDRASKSGDKLIEAITLSTLANMKIKDKEKLRFISQAKPRVILNVKMGSPEFFLWKNFAISGVVICKHMPPKISVADQTSGTSRNKRSDAFLSIKEVVPALNLYSVN